MKINETQDIRIEYNREVNMPLGPIQAIFERVPVFALVLFRIAGIMFFAPLLGSAAIPVKVRLMLALVLSVAVFPLVSPVVVPLNSYLVLAIAVGREMLIGITMGFVLLLLFTGVQIGAEMVSHQMGWAMARLFDPMTQIQTNLLSEFYLLLATLFYVLMNGHLILIKSLLETFNTIPLLSGGVGLTGIVNMLVTVLTEAFKLGIRMAGPALVAIFLATLAMGFVSRTMPQLNILAAGFPVRITLALVLLIASMGMVMSLFQNDLIWVFRIIGRIFMT